jgi:transposase InsO family protein
MYKPMKKHKIAPEFKEQIINRIKNDGITVVEATKDPWHLGRHHLCLAIQKNRRSADTYIPFQGKTVYLATVLDLFSRKVVGLSVYTTHAAQLVLTAFLNALHNHPRPDIFHSDNGSEYNSEVFIEALQAVGVSISRSAPGCPWENGYQESFYDKFKIDLGDPNRFKTLGELVYEIYQTIWKYNHTRIHTALRMPPQQFATPLKTLGHRGSWNLLCQSLGIEYLYEPGHPKIPPHYMPDLYGKDFNFRIELQYWEIILEIAQYPFFDFNS